MVGPRFRSTASPLPTVLENIQVLAGLQKFLLPRTQHTSRGDHLQTFEPELAS